MSRINPSKVEARRLRKQFREAADGGDSRLAQVLSELARSTGRRRKERLDDFQRMLDTSYTRWLDLFRECPMFPV